MRRLHGSCACDFRGTPTLLLRRPIRWEESLQVTFLHIRADESSADHVAHRLIQLRWKPAQGERVEEEVSVSPAPRGGGGWGQARVKDVLRAEDRDDAVAPLELEYALHNA